MRARAMVPGGVEAMTKQITSEEFEALKAKAASIETERETNFTYENLLDDDGNEIAFATYQSYREPIFTLREA